MAREKRRLTFVLGPALAGLVSSHRPGRRSEREAAHSSPAGRAVIRSCRAECALRMGHPTWGLHLQGSGQQDAGADGGHVGSWGEVGVKPGMARPGRPWWRVIVGRAPRLRVSEQFSIISPLTAQQAVGKLSAALAESGDYHTTRGGWARWIVKATRQPLRSGSGRGKPGRAGGTHGGRSSQAR
jgi:hypothetical protein